MSIRRCTTAMDQIIILCKDVQKTSSIYCQALGLKMILQSPQFVQLRDKNQMRIFLKSCKKPFQLVKGYTPVLSFRVQYFDEVRQKLLRNQLIQDGEVIEMELGKIANFMGPEGEHISINNLKIQEQQQIVEEGQDKSTQQIKNILNQIKF